MSNPRLRSYAYSEILLALCIWREGRGESYTAMAGIAWTVRNRVEHPKWWGTDYVSCITRKWQYSAMAAPGDPQLIHYPQEADAIFPICLDIATGIMDDRIEDPTQGATSYFDDSIPPPAWATPERFACKIGRLNFYRVDVDS